MSQTSPVQTCMLTLNDSLLSGRGATSRLTNIRTKAAEVVELQR